MGSPLGLDHSDSVAQSRKTRAVVAPSRSALVAGLHDREERPDPRLAVEVAVRRPAGPSRKLAVTRMTQVPAASKPASARISKGVSWGGLGTDLQLRVGRASPGHARDLP